MRSRCVRSPTAAGDIVKVGLQWTEFITEFNSTGPPPMVVPWRRHPDTYRKIPDYYDVLLLVLPGTLHARARSGAV